DNPSPELRHCNIGRPYSKFEPGVAGIIISNSACGLAGDKSRIVGGATGVKPGPCRAVAKFYAFAGAVVADRAVGGGLAVRRSGWGTEQENACRGINGDSIHLSGCRS